MGVKRDEDKATYILQLADRKDPGSVAKRSSDDAADAWSDGRSSGRCPQQSLRLLPPRLTWRGISYCPLDSDERQRYGDARYCFSQYQAEPTSSTLPQSNEEERSSFLSSDIF